MYMEERPRVGDIVLTEHPSYWDKYREPCTVPNILCIITEVGVQANASIILKPLNPANVQRLIINNYGCKVPTNGEYWHYSYEDVELIKKVCEYNE